MECIFLERHKTLVTVVVPLSKELGELRKRMKETSSSMPFGTLWIYALCIFLFKVRKIKRCSWSCVVCSFIWGWGRKMERAWVGWGGRRDIISNVEEVAHASQCSCWQHTIRTSRWGRWRQMNKALALRFKENLKTGLGGICVTSRRGPGSDYFRATFSTIFLICAFCPSEKPAAVSSRE